MVDDIPLDSRFSGVVRVDEPGETTFARAQGFAQRGERIENTVDTRFGIASGAKGFTALSVVSLIAEGRLSLDTTARSVLGADLPLIDDSVTIEHLLSHHSGIGDYFDEDAEDDINAYVMPIPVHQLATAEQYVPILDGYPQVFPPGQQFAYNNGAFVVLAVIAERVSGVPYHDLVDERVCRPAQMAATEFLRSDQLPGGVAYGYLDDDSLRTNIMHLPVRGVGDGGIYSTAADMHAFWAALFAGAIVPLEWVSAMARPRIDGEPADPRRYGLGFWLAPVGPGVLLEGYDAGVSFRSGHDPVNGATFTVISNTSSGAWPVARILADRFTP